MTIMRVIILSLFLLAGTVGISIAAQAADETSILNPSGMAVPRFVTLKSDYVNARVGPGKRYPIRWVFKRKRLPVSIVEEFANWRKIQDRDGDGGWVHKSLLSGERSVIIKGGTQHLYTRPDSTSRPVVRAGENVIAQVDACTPDWCELMIGEYKGWARKADIWGVAREEVFEE